MQDGCLDTRRRAAPAAALGMARATPDHVRKRCRPHKRKLGQRIHRRSPLCHRGVARRKSALNALMAPAIYPNFAKTNFIKQDGCKGRAAA